jgi:biopolymer transport protein ExbB
MRIHKLLAAAATLGAVLAIGQAQGQTQAAASGEITSLNQLLELVQKGQSRDNSQQAARLKEFQQRQADQVKLLQQAQAEKAREEERSSMLEKSFDENELTIADVQQQLDERLGALKELFGVLQQVSGDARSAFQNSLTNIEFPDRTKFLSEFAAKMGQTSKLPSIEEIERVWFELQREATELGKIKRLPNFPVITSDGTEVNEDVVRVGAFNLITDGAYLRKTDNDTVAELQRQPTQGRYINSTSALVDAGPNDGFVRFGMDLTRGTVLSLLIETPEFMEQVSQGGYIGYITIALGVLGVLIAFERIITLGIAGRKVHAQLKSDTVSPNNPLGRVLLVYRENPNADTETLELKLGEAILKEVPRLQRGILFIKIISVVAPLLGLLGTVTGMIQTFQAITLFGTGDPTVMAGGISQALVTTVIGLVVAIPTVLLHTFVNGRARNIIQVLQEQSAGIVARQAEKTAP